MRGWPQRRGDPDLFAPVSVSRARAPPRTSTPLSGTSPARVLRVRHRPRHALDLLLRDRSQVVLVRDVRRGVRIPGPDTGEKEVLAGAMQVVPAGHLSRHLALPLVHDEVQGHLAGGDQDRRITLMAHRAQLRRVRRRRVTGGAHAQYVDVVRGHLRLAQAHCGLGCDQVGLAQTEDDAVLAAVQIVEPAGSPVVLELLQRRMVGVAELAQRVVVLAAARPRGRRARRTDAVRLRLPETVWHLPQQVHQGGVGAGRRPHLAAGQHAAVDRRAAGALRAGAGGGAGGLGCETQRLEAAVAPGVDPVHPRTAGHPAPARLLGERNRQRRPAGPAAAADAPTWLPGNMLPLIGAPLVHFGQVPAGLLVVWFANHTVWKLPSNRVSTTSTPGPQGTAPQRVCWKSEIANGVGRTRRKGRPSSSTRVIPAAQPPAPPSYWLRKTTWL